MSEAEFWASTFRKLGKLSDQHIKAHTVEQEEEVLTGKDALNALKGLI